MFTTLFAHAGHHADNTTNMSSMSDIEHCAPIIIGAGVIIIILFLIILYFLLAWQPKTAAKPQATKAKKAKPAAKKSARK